MHGDNTPRALRTNTILRRFKQGDHWPHGYNPMRLWILFLQIYNRYNRMKAEKQTEPTNPSIAVGGMSIIAFLQLGNWIMKMNKKSKIAHQYLKPYRKKMEAEPVIVREILKGLAYSAAETDMDDEK